MQNSRPLVVDLDGSLIRSDILLESALQFVHQHPFAALAPLGWLRRGKAALKEELAARVDIDVSLLPYEPSVLSLIDEARSQGRPVVLATASHQKYADQVAGHLGCFDRVMATGNGVNLKGPVKSEALAAAFGRGEFDYVGDSTADIPVWSVAHTAYPVNPGDRLLRQAREANSRVEPLPGGQTTLSVLGRAMRLKHWAKNALIFVPLLASHQADDLALVTLGVLAFLCFGLAASSVYLLNDLLDLQNDRRHPVKRRRPLAAGELPARLAVLLIAACLVLAFSVSALLLPAQFTLCLGLYYALTLAYSVLLKRIFLLDVVVLATLYTLRVIAGTQAFDTEPTTWLLAFSMTLFLSLGMVKRYAELHVARDRGIAGTLPGRAYSPTNQRLLALVGAAAGLGSVAVLALYVQAETASDLYTRPAVIWLACPVLLAWLVRMWRLAWRGEMQEDPVDFAIRDGASLLLGLLFALVFVVAL